jgi:hypothetical protein
MVVEVNHEMAKKYMYRNKIVIVNLIAIRYNTHCNHAQAVSTGVAPSVKIPTDEHFKTVEKKTQKPSSEDVLKRKRSRFQVWSIQILYVH